MRLDFLHRELMRRRLELGRTNKLACCARSSYQLKNQIKVSGGETSLALFEYGKLIKPNADQMINDGYQIIAEPFEVDSFYTNDFADYPLISTPDQTDQPIVTSDQVSDLFASHSISRYLPDGKTLPNTLLIRLPQIKARTLVNAMKIDGIFITNGENCSLDMGKPSSVVQSYGYSEDESREAISLSWNPQTCQNSLFEAINKLIFRYKQIRSIS